MKRIKALPLLLFGAISLIVSCEHQKQRAHGFVNEPQDSIWFNLKDYVLPASEVSIWDVKKCGGYYYVCFHERTRSDFNASHSILMAVSEDKLQTMHVPLPDEAYDFTSISNKNDTLVMKLKDERFFSLNPKSWEWSSYSFRNEDSGTKFEDDDWTVKYAYHGEFGEVTWFIDKQSKDEYAFVELTGNVRRIDSTFYVINETRIYELNNPSIGFHCDSLTTYERAKDIRLIAVHFHRAGYSPMNHTFSPIVQFDNENPAIEKHEESGITWYDGGFYLSDFAKADTIIVDSFIAADTLFFALNTPSGLELVKLDGDTLSSVHHFDKDAGISHLRFRLLDEFPCIASSVKYRECPSSPDEKLLLLLNVEPGCSELIDIAHDGNSLIKLCYDHSGLHTVEQDGFRELFSFYLKNWDDLTLERVLHEEKDLGGEVSYLNLESNRNSFPPKEIFDEHENFHIDIISKLIGNSYKVDSEYWVQESDKSIPAVIMDWSRLDYNSGFSPKEKYEQVAGIITDSVGPGTLYPATNGKMKYTEWHSGQRVIRLYGGTYDVRFILY